MRMHQPAIEDSNCKISDASNDYESNGGRESSARTYGSFFRPTFVRGKLSRVWDKDGKEYIDCLAGAGALPLGHNHPVMNEAIREFMARSPITQGLDLSTPDREEFIKEVFLCLPEAFAKTAKIHFCGPSGSDAVEGAIKLFKHSTGRNGIFCFHGAYHGMTAGALALTGNIPAREPMGALMSEVNSFMYPRPFQGGECPQHADRSIASIRAALEDPNSGIRKPAAIILEVVQGEGGVLPAPVDWLRELSALAAKEQIPLIIDEIQTGFGRTGTMFAFEQAGIIPDAIVISKAAGGGFPLAAILYNNKHDLWKPGAHAGTFRGNQIAMATGASTLRFIRESNLQKQAMEKGKLLYSFLCGMKEHYSEIVDVRGLGLMLGVQIKSQNRKKALTDDGELVKEIKRSCFDHGLIVETGGRNGTVLRFLPPLILSEAEIDEISSKLTRSFEQVLRN